jgi:tRNA A58 N-methylase Trm61
MTRTAARFALAAALLLALTGGGCAAGKRIAYEGVGRDDWQMPDAVIALLGVGPGDVVLEQGPGDGYFTFRLAEAVGESGRVYAWFFYGEDYDGLKRKARERGAANVVVPRVGPFSDEIVLDGEVDLVFLCNTYRQLDDRPTYFRYWLTALAPNGRVAIIEPDDHGGAPADEIAREMREAGYERIANHEILTRQSFQIFRADDGTGE